MPNFGRNNKGLFIAAQAYLEYEADTFDSGTLDIDSAKVLVNERGDMIFEYRRRNVAKWLLNKLVLLPEYLMARRRLERELTQLGVDRQLVSLDDFARDTKADIEAAMYAGIPLLADSRKAEVARFVAEMDNPEFSAELARLARDVREPGNQ